MDRMTQLFATVPTGIVFPEQFGAVGDGVTNDYAAMVQWVAHAGTDRLGLNGTKNYAIASASLGLAGLTLPNGAFIEAVGMGGPNITVTGSSPCNLFKATDIQNVTIRNVWIVGNGPDVSSFPENAGSFLNFRLTSKANSPNGRSGLYMENCRLDWFYGPWWVGFWCEDPSTIVAACQLTHCRFYSSGAPLPAAADQCCMVSIGNPAFDGSVQDVQIDHCYAGGYGVIKSFVNVWNNAIHVIVADNIMEGFGYGIATNDYGCYAVQIEGGSATGYPDVIKVTNNQIINPWSAGVWALGVANIDISGNYCSGETDNQENTWQKGAYCVTGLQAGATCTIQRNTALNCYTGINAPSHDGAVTNVADNVCFSNVALGRGIHIYGDPGASTGRGVVNLSDNHVNQTNSNTTHALLISDNSSTGDSAGVVNVVGGSYACAGYYVVRTVDWVTAEGCWNGKITLRDVLISGPTTGYGLLHYNTNSPLTLDGVSVDAAMFGPASWAAYLYGVASLNLVDLTIRNFPNTSANGSYALGLVGARGSMPVGAVKFINCYPGFEFWSSDFGRSIPTWAADKGTQIANLYDPGSTGPQGWLNTNGATNWEATGAGAFLPLTGGTITGNLAITGNENIGGYAYATSPANGDNSNKLATTAFVANAVQEGGIVSPAYLPLTGGTLTGPLAINAPGSSYLAIADAAGTTRQLMFETGSLMRWGIAVGPAAETGSDAGSNLNFNSYHDSGALLGTPLTINRANGNAVFSAGVWTGGPIYATSVLAVNGPAGTDRELLWMTNGVVRWNLDCDTTAETGGNSGSDLAFDCYSDSGAFLATALIIERSNANATFYGALSAQGNIYANNNIIYWGAAGWYQQVTAQWTFQAPNGSCYMDRNGNWVSNSNIIAAGYVQANGALTGNSLSITNNANIGGVLAVGGQAYGITPVATDNSTNFATTAFVHNAIQSSGGGSYLPLAGGTLTGPLTVNAPGQSQINITDAAGNIRGINLQTAGVARWQINAGSNAESGSNAGSNLNFNSYTDSGTLLGTPLSINRASGQATFSGPVQCQQLSIVNTNPTLYMNKPASGDSCALIGQTAGNNRWAMYLGDGGGETGSDAGSNFGLAAIHDNGSWNNWALTISRAAPFTAVFTGGVNTGGAINATGAVNTYGPNGALVANPRSGSGENFLLYNSEGSYLRIWSSGSGDLVLFSDSLNQFYHPITVSNLIRIKPTAASSGAYGAMWYGDTSNFYLLFTNNNDADGGWNGLRPVYFDFAGGNSYFGGNMNVNGTFNGNSWANVQGTLYLGGAGAGQGAISAGGGQTVNIGTGTSGNLAQIVTYCNTLNNQGAYTGNGAMLNYGDMKCYGYVCRQGYNGGWSSGGNHFNLYWVSPYMQIWVDNTNLGNFPSDYRIKRNIGKLGSMWEKVKQLRPIRYNLKDYSPEGHQQEDGLALFQGDDVERWGFVAHELQEDLIGDAATGAKDEANTIQSINPMPVIAALTKALQEAMQRIEALEAQVARA